MICLSLLGIRTCFFQKSKELKERAFFNFTKPLLVEMSPKCGLNLVLFVTTLEAKGYAFPPVCILGSVFHVFFT